MEITADELRRQLAYDPETGVFTRKVRAGPSKAGEVAGSINAAGYLEISVSGKRYRGQRLAWLYMTGAWPVGDVGFLPGADTTIPRWHDLFLIPASPAPFLQGVRPYVSRVDKTITRFSAVVSERGKMVFIGGFSSERQAHNAWRAAKRRIARGLPARP